MGSNYFAHNSVRLNVGNKKKKTKKKNTFFFGGFTLFAGTK